MNYTVTYYKSDGWDTVEDFKNVTSREKAEEVFEDFLGREMGSELKEGLISDQEFRNIVCNGIYTYSNNDLEVTISIELTEDIFGKEDE